MKRVLSVVAGLAAVVAAVLLAVLFWPASLPEIPDGAADPTDEALVARGAYLARAADCIACHVTEDGAPYAGGLAFPLPFGVIYSSNITPDPETGIGAWSDAEFVRAVRHGVGREGENLYPAFPYASYALMSQEDALAIRAYLATVPPVRYEAPANRLEFPFSVRAFVRFWNLLEMPGSAFEPDPDRSADWNRGAYLVEALGHCGECHTPRNVWYGLDEDRKFAGDEAQAWRAYNITSAARFGVGDWTVEEIADYLQHGHAEGRGIASGTMAEVVEYSTSRLERRDLLAMAEYLKAVPPRDVGVPAATEAAPFAEARAAVLPAAAVLDDRSLGRQVFQTACSSCHAWNGAGLTGPLAALGGDRSLQDPAATNVLQAILHGTAIETPTARAVMPAFGAAYTDREIAAVASFVLGYFGGVEARITPEAVRDARGDVGARPTP